MTEQNLPTEPAISSNGMLGEGWLDANVHFPDELEAVFISNGKGWIAYTRC